MRILFMSGVGVGGAPRSTVELAGVLAQRGHDVEVALGQASSSSGPYGLAVRACVKLRPLGVSGPRVLLRPFGRRLDPTPDPPEGVTVWSVARPENALRRLMEAFDPDIVVANSFPREQMAWIAADLAARGTPMALYVREEHAVTHISVSGLRPDVVLANAHQLADQVRAEGTPCTYIPSVVDLAASLVESSRSSVTLVNPINENRPSILKDLADRRPDILCVLQESWPLGPAEREELEEWARSRPNLHIRQSVPHPAAIYRDARIVLAPYPSGRPRVVAEAQYNGIPVIGRQQPALAEAIGDGGILVPGNLANEAWVDEIEGLWDDASRYAELVEAARSHARRDEVNPEVIAGSVEAALGGVLR